MFYGRTLDKFIKAGFDRGETPFGISEYVEESGFKYLYVRFGKSYIEGEFVWPTLVLSNISVKNKGNGTFTNLLRRLKNDYPELNLYVENALERRFVDKLIRLGFKPKISIDEITVSLYLRSSTPLNV